MNASSSDDAKQAVAGHVTTEAMAVWLRELLADARRRVTVGSPWPGVSKPQPACQRCGSDRLLPVRNGIQRMHECCVCGALRARP